MRAVVRLAAILLVAVVASLTTRGVADPTAAAAAASCDEQVLRDWYSDGRIDRTYELECYEVAVASLPSDLRDYTNAQAEIERALQSAVRSADAREPSAATSSSASLAALAPALAAAASAALAGGGLWFARRARSTRTDDDGSS